MATTKKAQAIARELQAELKQRLSAPFGTPLIVADVSFDSDQNPLIKIGTGAVGVAGGLVKIKPLDWPLAQQITGLPQQVYDKHTIQFVNEASVSANTLAILNRILATIQSRGCKVQLFQSTNGTAPDASQFIDANLKDTYEASVQYPMLQGQ